MKTQRPRDRANQRQSPDDSRVVDDSNGIEDGASEENGASNVTARNLPPALPKRKAGRSIPPSSKSTTAIADAPTMSEATLSSEVSEVAKPEVPMSASAGASSTSSKLWSAFITYENVFWFLIFAVAIVTRFWDVGSRALHHDESLHAVYSRNLYSGAGYTHDPMMHGPLQFHYIAIMFWLFGTSDATVRFASIACGLFVVMSPFFLRRQMGRLTAVICGFLLLVSPAVLYYSRMAREDAIFSGMEMIMIVGLWRFLSERKPRDFYLFAAGLSLMFTIKESAYLTTAVLAIFFLLLFAFQAGWAVFGATAAYGLVMGALGLLYRQGTKPGQTGLFTKLPDIPNTNPDFNTIRDFAIGFLTHPLILISISLTLIYIGTLIALFLMKRSSLKSKPARTRTAVAARTNGSGVPTRKISSVSGNGSKATNGAALENGTEGAPVSVVASSVEEHEAGEAEAESPSTGNGSVAETVAPTPRPRKKAEASNTLWNPHAIRPKRGTLFAHYEEGSLPHLLGALMSRPSVLLIGLLVFTTIFVVFYSVFFTDVPRGILSGMFGSLGYWMGQQGVRRGDQPWFYYFLLVPLYQPIAVFFSVAAGIFFSWRGVRWLLDRFTSRYDDDEPRLGAFNTDRPIPFARFDSFLPLFLAWWLIGVLAIYSWAGEKMPWLMFHITRPAIFFASLFIGALVAAVIANRRKRLAEAGMWERGHEGPQFYPTDRRGLAGARFSLNARRESLGLGVSKRELAYAYPPNSAQYSARGSGRGPVAAARSGGARAAVAVMRNQDPPWVAWNRPNALFPFASYMVLFLLFAVAWGITMSRITYMVEHGELVNGVAASYKGQWGITWVYPILMAVMTVAFAVWLGVTRALRYLGLAILGVFLIYEVHSSIQLTYRNPDVSTELAVYVQSAPDVTRVMRELEAYSYYSTGAKDVKIVYDSEVSWPMEWYLGDYKNKKFIGGGTPSDEDLTTAPVMFLGYNRLNDEKINANFVAQRYALRWWFPEEWYKGGINDPNNPGFLPNQYAEDASGQVINDAEGKPKPASPFAQIGDAIHTTSNMLTMPSNQAELWKYLIFRETPKPLGSTDFVLFVRKDVVQMWHNLQNKPLPTTDVAIEKDSQPIKPYTRLTR